MLTLEQELMVLKARVDRIEATVRQLTGDGDTEAAPPPGERLDPQRVLAWLKTEGLIVEPSPLARDHAERWRALPEEEKRQIRYELDHLPPGPMASDVVMENRR